MTNKAYRPVLSASLNRKGVLDIDTVKGCRIGMAKYPNGGCYGLCYANKLSTLYGFDFSKSISREMNENKDQLKLFDYMRIGSSNSIFNMVKSHNLSWFRIGVMGDPCHNWELTYDVCEWLGLLKTPVIVTKHWIKVPDDMLNGLRKNGVVFNTSISPLDTNKEITHRLREFNRLKNAGLNSVLRIVSCKFGDTSLGKKLKYKQEFLFSHSPVIDNPLRIPPSDKRVLNGHIKTEKLKSGRCFVYMSKANPTTYTGTCSDCPDQCGVYE